MRSSSSFFNGVIGNYYGGSSTGDEDDTGKDGGTNGLLCMALL